MLPVFVAKKNWVAPLNAKRNRIWEPDDKIQSVTSASDKGGRKEDFRKL